MCTYLISWTYADKLHTFSLHYILYHVRQQVHTYEKHALRVSRVIAVLAKSACKHAIFLATRVKKRVTKLDLRNFATRSEVIIFFFSEKVKQKLT